jgi:uncharacterized protein
MKVILLNGSAMLKKALMAFLVVNEAVNSLVFSTLSKPDVLKLSLIAIDDADRIKSAAFLHSSNKLFLTEGPDEVFYSFATFLHDKNLTIDCVAGPVEAVRTFSLRWSQLRNGSNIKEKIQAVYQLQKIRELPSVNGELRLAESSDIDALTPWSAAFIEESDLSEGNPDSVVRRLIQENRLYIWQTSKPVSMSAWSGPTPNGVRVNFVYTPTDLRGKGYATACVTALCQNLLQSHYKKIFLFTDVNNLPARTVYEKIGFKLADEFLEVEFTKPAETH